MAPKRIFYLNRLAHPVFAEIMREHSDVSLTGLVNDSPESEAAPVLARAHAYQIPSVRDELAPQFHARAALLARTPDLLVVSTSGAGYDTVDVDDCTRAGVLAMNQAGGNARSVAEHALGMMLCLNKMIVQADRRMRREAGIRRLDYMNAEAYGKTLGIIGIGNVGTRIAELCGGVIGMRVLACDPYLSAEQIAARGAEKVGLEEVLRRSDFVSLSCPLNAETRGMIGAKQYAMMQSHAYFITTARGGIHDEQALAQALADKRIAGAGLDVWDPEPPPPDHPLLRFDNVIASPHTAGTTREARRNVGTMAAQQLLDVLEGKRPARLLNPQAWPAFAKRFERVFGFAPPA
jgi:D-3-phosphoglycerate dehydrogenase / 2-oxoglutarate reductase